MTAPSPTGDRGLDLVLARLEDIAADLRDMRANYVPTAVWVQRNAHVDSRLQSIGRELGDLRTEVRSKRVPWPSVASVVISGAALLVVLVQAIGP